jgi:hypothetical protein
LELVNVCGLALSELEEGIAGLGVTVRFSDRGKSFWEKVKHFLKSLIP